MEVQLNLTNQFQKLRNAFEDSHKYVVIPAGRRVGKTWEAKDWLIKEGFSGKAKNALWVDTIQANIDKYVQRYFRTTLGNLWSLFHWDAQKKILTFPKGCNFYIDFVSAEKPQNMEGFEYDRVVVNECGIVFKKSGLWGNTIQPMTKGVNNKTRFIGTPKGRNTFWELYNLGITNAEGYKSISFSAYESPYWDESELDKIKKVVPVNVWEQEYMARFLENNAGVFRNVKGCIREIRQIDKALDGHKYVIGIDLAKHTDFTVVIVMDIQSNEVVNMTRFNTIDWVYQKEKIVELWERFGKCYIMLDSTGVGDPVYDDLYRKMGEKLQGYKFNSVSKKELIEGLAMAIDSTLLYYPNIDELIAELEAYEYEVTRSGNVTYNAPEGLHDDIVIAIALAWQLAKPSNKKYGYFAI